MVDKYIKELLGEHGRVYIPNFLLIYKDYKSDDSNDPYIISQPRPNFLIDSEYRNEDDTWLAYAVARGEHVTLEDAEQLIRERVESLKTSLDNYSRVEIEGVGSIQKESDTWVMTNTGVFSEEETEQNYGIPRQISVEEQDRAPLSYDTVNAREQEEEEIVQEQSNYDSELNESHDDEEVQEEELESNELEFAGEPEKKSSKVIWVAAAAIILMLGFGGLYYFYLMPQSGAGEEVAASSDLEDDSIEDQQIPEDNDSTKIATASMAGENSGSDTSGGNKPLSLKEEGKRYYIIAGAFNLNENAQKLKRQLRTKGVKAKVIKSKDSQELFRVSIADFDNFEQALAKTQDLKDEHGNSIWILKY